MFEFFAVPSSALLPLALFLLLVLGLPALGIILFILLSIYESIYNLFAKEKIHIIDDILKDLDK